MLDGEVVELIPREEGRQGTSAPIHGGGAAGENPLGTGRKTVRVSGVTLS